MKYKEDIDVAVYIGDNIDFIGSINECAKRLNTTRLNILKRSSNWYWNQNAKRIEKDEEALVIVRLDDYKYE